MWKNEWYWIKQCDPVLLVIFGASRYFPTTQSHLSVKVLQCWLNEHTTRLNRQNLLWIHWIHCSQDEASLTWDKEIYLASDSFPFVSVSSVCSTDESLDELGWSLQVWGCHVRDSRTRSEVISLTHPHSFLYLFSLPFKTRFLANKTVLLVSVPGCVRGFIPNTSQFE